MGSGLLTSVPSASKYIALDSPVKDPWSLCHPHQDDVEVSSAWTAVHVLGPIQATNSKNGNYKAHNVYENVLCVVALRGK